MSQHQIAMSESMVVTYQLTRDLWRAFFEAHYACDHRLTLRYWWGVTCVVIGCLGLGGFYDSPLVAVLFMLTGFFGVLSKQLLVVKSLRGACRHPFFGEELIVELSAEEIAVRSGDAGYSQPWSNFTGYRLLPPGLLLYHDQNAFFFIPAAVLMPADMDKIKSFLKTADVSKL